MARVTVEDCIKVIPSRFELVALAAERTREIAAGAPVAVQRESDKDPVVALREIAEKKVSPKKLRDSLVNACRSGASAEKYHADRSRSDSTSVSAKEAREEISSLTAAEDEAAEASVYAGMYSGQDVEEDKAD